MKHLLERVFLDLLDDDGFLIPGGLFTLDLEFDQNVLSGSSQQNSFQFPLLEAQMNGIETLSIADRRDVPSSAQLTGRPLPGFRSSRDFQLLLLHS